MKYRVIGFVAFLFMTAVGVYFIVNKPNDKLVVSEELEEEDKENAAAFRYLRWKYEADMVRDPTTGEPLFGLREQETEFAQTIPERYISSGSSRILVQNTYYPAGPNNQGGRTRAIAYDMRYNGSSNRVILSGGISGGILRSADGGATWTRVTPANEVHNVASIAQNPLSPDTWYAGGGEYVGNSADALGASYLGHALLKSTDNGVSWSRVPLTNLYDHTNAQIVPIPPFTEFLAERFDHTFDFVHRIAFNPVNGDLYIAGHRRIMRSTDNGSTFRTVFGNATAAPSSNGQCDVAISQTGKVYVGYTGSAPDFTLRGVWRSTSGNLNSFTRLAGGSSLGVDSVANWRGNSYDLVDGAYTTRRILLALAPSNENLLYVLYENGLINTSSSRVKEADLFKLDMTSGFNWTNLSNNLPDFPGGDHDATDPITVQEGYDLFIAVKPNNPNFVLIGGTSLYRSTDGFATANYDNTLSWIGGYNRNFASQGLNFHPGSHPDIHNVVFNPQNSNEAICANDGGLQVTSDITASGSTVTWNNIMNYQTLQYYRIGIDPETGSNNIVGGTQDNGTQFRDKTRILGTTAADSNNHRRVLGGDGNSVGITKKNGNIQHLFAGVFFGSIRRGQIQPSLGVPAGAGMAEIRPTGLTPAAPGSTTEFGEFVTNFRLNPSNTDDLFYVNFHRLFRTTNSTTVTSSGWTELTGVGFAINPNFANTGVINAIRAMAFSHGQYGSSHSMYIGTTDGKILRLDDPRNAPANTSPFDITPPTSVVNISGYNVQDIAVNPNNDNEIIAVISNYGRAATVGGQAVIVDAPSIIWTNNAKSATPTWKKAEGNLTGTNTSGYISARSAVIAVKKDASGNPVTEYYVGTAAGLYAVENLGTTLAANGQPTWQRDGSSSLNFAVISSLAYRPEDNVMAIGTHGNGLYYTFLGTPNIVTGINNPILNDKDFITSVYPTIQADLVQYRIGNRTDVKKISVQVFNMKGQELYRQEMGYQNGNVNFNRFAKGAYVLSIYSDNGKYRHIQKIIR